MKALVLGGSGFIGSWIIRELLSRKIYSSSFCRQKTESFHDPLINLIKGDCKNYEDMLSAVAGHDTLFHAASFYPDYSLQRERQFKTALTELDNVLNAAKENKVKRFVYISSPTVINASEKSIDLSTYCYIKYHLHKRVEEEIAEGFPGIIVIPGGCFGPGDAKVVTGRIILEILSRRLKMICEGRMNIVDVRDVARSCVDAAVQNKIGKTYQFGNWNCLVSEFVEKVANLAGIPAPKNKIPYFISKSAAKFIEHLQFFTFGGKPFLPETGLDMVNFSNYLDSSIAVKELNFTALPVDKTILDAINWYKTNNYLTHELKINFGRLPEFRLEEKFV
jgi:dihydroflavonol-4-reductase